MVGHMTCLKILPGKIFTSCNLVCTYLALRTRIFEPLCRDKERAAGSGKGSEAAPEAVQSALQGVALVLPCVTPESQALLLDAVASLATRSPSKVPLHLHTMHHTFRHLRLPQ